MWSAMSNVKVVLNSAGVREMLQSKEMLAICEEHAQRAVSRLGPGYEVTSMVGRTRVNAEVRAVWPQAQADNLKNNTILKALK